MRLHTIGLWSTRVALLLIWMCSISMSTAAKAQEATTSLKVEVRRVILDVVVTGGDGGAARGLARKDFLLKEDGKEQSILTFEEHDLDGPPEFTPPGVPCLPAGTFVNLPKTPERGPLYVLLYDVANMEREDQPVARQQLVRFMEAKDPGTRFAIVVLSNGAHLAQGFTDDKATLLAAIKDKVPPFFLQASNYGRGNPSVAVDAFTKIGNFLDGLPGRKNVIWFSGQFPLLLVPDAANSGAGVIYSGAQREIVNTLAKDEIAIYPVDVRGLATDAEYVSGTGQGPKAHTGSEHTAYDPKTGQLKPPPPPSESQTIAPTYSALGDSYLTENEIARESGGQAFHGRNDLAGALEAAVRTGGTYYTLTYSPGNRVYDGKTRWMRVDVPRTAYRLAYRRAYVAEPPRGVQPRGSKAAVDGAATTGLERSNSLSGDPLSDPPSDSLRADDLRVNMRHGAPLNHNLVFAAEIHALGAASPATPEQMGELAQPTSIHTKGSGTKRAGKPGLVWVRTYTVQFKLSAAEIERGRPSGAEEASLVFATAAYDRSGTLLSSVTQSTVAPVGRGDDAASADGAEQRIAVPVNAAWLRVGMEDTASLRTGSVEVALPVATAQTCAPGHSKPRTCSRRDGGSP